VCAVRAVHAERAPVHTLTYTSPPAHPAIHQLTHPLHSIPFHSSPLSTPLHLTYYPTPISLHSTRVESSRLSPHSTIAPLHSPPLLSTPLHHRPPPTIHFTARPHSTTSQHPPPITYLPSPIIFHLCSARMCACWLCACANVCAFMGVWCMCLCVCACVRECVSA
jgi:hypothetical protein